MDAFEEPSRYIVYFCLVHCVLRDGMVRLLWDHGPFSHNGRDGVSNHQPHECLLKRLFRRRWKKTPKLRVTDLCVGNSPVTGEFPAQMTSNAEIVCIWWRHHVSLARSLSSCCAQPITGQFSSATPNFTYLARGPYGMESTPSVLIWTRGWLVYSFCRFEKIHHYLNTAKHNRVCEIRKREITW